MTEEFVPIYDLESLTEDQRRKYIKTVCRHLGVPDDMNLVCLAYIDDGDGPRHLVPYAKRGATEIIRHNKNINITNLTHEMVGGSIVFTATGKDSAGRQEMSSGSKYIKELTGKELDSAIMTAQTRAVRRMTLQFLGAGILDESEINPLQSIKTVETSSVVSYPQPISLPNIEPGKIVEVSTEKMKMIHTAQDPLKLEEKSEEQKQLDFEIQQKKLRDDAIATLNAKEATEVKPERKRRGRKPKVDFGPSEMPVKMEPVAPISVPPPMPIPVSIPVSTPTSISPPPSVPPPTQPNISVKGLTKEQAIPYRQRLFKLVSNQLEPAGFAPKEGIGNADKMRMLANIMFSEVNNTNELNAEQWEKYLTILETKIKTIGAVATIKYIEETIGI